MTVSSAKSLFVLAACMTLVSCGKKPAAAPDQGTAAKPAASVESLLTDSAANPPPATPAEASTPAPEQTAAANPAAPAGAPHAEMNEITSGAQLDTTAGKDLKGGELATPQVIAAYNKRLAMVNYQISDFPSKLEDLNKWPMMPPPPKAPPGKKIVYDVRTRAIRLE